MIRTKSTTLNFNMKVLFMGFLFLGDLANSYSQVNIQTGSASYDIPIYSYSDKKGVSTSVSISYSSGSGFRPNELAGNVGTGWALSAGGFIQRIQNGEPDDQDSRQAFPPFGCNGASYSTTNCYSLGFGPEADYIKNYYPNGFLYSEYDNLAGAPNSSVCLPHELKFNPRFLTNSYKAPWKMSRRAMADRQQDRFLFNINGRLGEFMIGKPSNGTKKILLPNGAKLKIDYDDSQDLSYMQVRTRIKSFTITDENGIVYKFKDYSLSHVVEFGTDAGFANSDNPQTGSILSCQGTTSPTFVICNGRCSPTCPYVYKTAPIPLTRLNPFVINKWYLSEIYNPLTKASIYFQYTTKDQDNITARSVSGTRYDGDNNVNADFTEEREVIKNKLLNSILLPDGSKVNLYYATIPRVDYKGNEPITKIETLYNGQLIGFYELTYGYFFKNQIVPYNNGPSYSGDDINYLRLCLQSVQKKTPGLSEPPYSFQYFNGSETGFAFSGSLVPPLHTLYVDYLGYYAVGDPGPNSTYGYVNFSQSYPRDGANNRAQIGLLKNIKIPFGGTVDYSYGVNFAKDATGVERSFGGVKVSQVTVNASDATGQPIITSYKYILEDGTSSGWGFEGTNLNEVKSTISLYDARREYGASSKPVTQSAISSIALGQIKTLIYKAIGAGLQALGASSYFANSFFITCLINRIYTILFDSDMGTDIAYWLGWIHDSTEEKSYTQSSYFPIVQRNPIGIHYSRVEVKNETANNGKVVYEFSRPSSDLHEIQPFTNSPAQRFPSYLFDNPIKTKYMDVNGDLVKQTENIYTSSTSQNTDASFLSCFADVTKSYSAPLTNANYLTDGNIDYYYYYPNTGYINLTKQVNTSYIGGVLADNNETNYTYDPSTLLLRETTTTNARGELVGKKTYYASDFPNSAVLQKLVNVYNVYNAGVSEATWLDKQNGSGPTLVGVVHNEFGELPNGDIKPIKQYQSELQAPVTSTLVGNPIDPANPTAQTFVKLQSTNLYNTSGDLIGITSATGKVNTLLYDYDGRYIVGNITNATSSDCAYTSFEGNNHNNFVIDNSGIIPENGLTGTKCYDAFKNISLPMQAGTDKKILSFWWKGNAPSIALSNGTPVLKEQTAPILGWVFYLYEIPSGTTSINIGYRSANASFVDELRCYPISARMATTTYNLPFGKSSVCSASNRLSFFEYDEFGRISKELDENRNVVKTYEYKFKTQ